MTSDELKHMDGQACYLFVPVVLIALALLIMTGFQCYVMLKERNSIGEEYARQTPVIEQAIKMRAQLDSIAKRTAQLAEEGNANARGLVEQLKKAGVTIHPEAPQKK